MKHSITMGEKVGYSLGDVAANLAFQMIMIYQLKFYTDIFGLDGAIAGTVLLIAPLASAFADPFIGIITDRTQTRWGKYRPWILWTALPFSIFYILAFSNPGIQDKTLVAIYATVSYILLLTLYGLNNTPYASLGGVMTDDIRERTSINKVRFVCTSIAQFVVQGFTLPLVDRFGNGNPAQGWQRTIILFAVLAFIFLIICFLSTRERIQPPPQQKMSIREDVSKTFSSVPWRSIFVLVLFMFIALAMWGASTNFYFQSYLDQSALSQFLNRVGFSTSSENAYIIGFSLFNTVNAVVQFLGVLFLSGFLANRFGKKTTFLAGLSLCTFFTALFYLPSPQDIGMVYLLCLLKSLAYGQFQMRIQFLQTIACGHRSRGTGCEAGTCETVSVFLDCFKHICECIAGDVIVPQRIAHLCELVEDHVLRILFQFIGLVEDLLDVTLATGGCDDFCTDLMQPVETLLAHLSRKDRNTSCSEKC